MTTMSRFVAVCCWLVVGARAFVAAPTRAVQQATRARAQRDAAPIAAPAAFLSDGLAPTDAELANENLVRIVNEECTDDDVNRLVWKCLGYRRRDDGSYDTAEVFPKWRDKYPDPPDLVGVQRIYTKEVDEPVLRANQALVASIPMKYKGGIREHLSKVGFRGFKLEGLTPNKTRRAQCANWLLYYREALYGLTLDELIAQKQRNIEEENRRLREAGESLRVATGGAKSTDSQQPRQDAP